MYCITTEFEQRRLERRRVQLTTTIENNNSCCHLTFHSWIFSQVLFLLYNFLHVCVHAKVNNQLSNVLHNYCGWDVIISESHTKIKRRNLVFIYLDTYVNCLQYKVSDLGSTITILLLRGSRFSPWCIFDFGGRAYPIWVYFATMVVGIYYCEDEKNDEAMFVYLLLLLGNLQHSMEFILLIMHAIEIFR